jgi:plastocyanin
MMMNRSMLLAAAVVVAAVLSVAGCGDNSNQTSTTGAAPTTAATGGTTSTSKGAGAPIKIGVDPGGQFKFQPTSLNVAAGSHKLVFTNNTGVMHDVIVGTSFDPADKIGGVSKIANGVETTTLKLKAGKYSYYCDVPGHREAGMTGTLTVK